jgi:hypothetical protein
MVIVEGLNIKAKRVPKKQLLQVWESLTDQPYPNIKALILSDNDFNHVIEHRACPEDMLREIEEWGRVLSTKGTDACIFNGEAADYVILVRENPYHKIEEILPHELLHIINGDL